jgi:hypothetical protein
LLDTRGSPGAHADVEAVSAGDGSRRIFQIQTVSVDLVWSDPDTNRAGSE